jgi:hypothetical protein
MKYINYKHLPIVEHILDTIFNVFSNIINNGQEILDEYNGCVNDA